MTAALGSEEDEAPKPRLLLMLSISAELADLHCNGLLWVVWAWKAGIGGRVMNCPSEPFVLFSPENSLDINDALA